MMIKHVTSFQDLLAVLRSDLPAIPPLLTDRNGTCEEVWTLYHWLAGRGEKLSYPIEIAKRERPDFLLRSGNLDIGVEVTELVQRDYNRARALLEREEGDGWVLDPSHFKWGQPPKSLEELRGIVAQTRLTGPPWVGNSVEREFAQAVHDVALHKSTKLRSEGFARFSENALLVYCNLTLPVFNAEEGLVLAADVLRMCNHGFDSIFVVKGSSLFAFVSGGGECLAIPTL